MFVQFLNLRSHAACWGDGQRCNRQQSQRRAQRATRAHTEGFYARQFEKEVRYHRRRIEKRR